MSKKKASKRVGEKETDRQADRDKEKKESKMPTTETNGVKVRVKLGTLVEENVHW